MLATLINYGIAAFSDDSAAPLPEDLLDDFEDRRHPAQKTNAITNIKNLSDVLREASPKEEPSQLNADRDE